MNLRRLNHQKGFTVVEVMIATLILVPLFAIGMMVFVKCMDLSDMSKNSSLAVWGVKKRIASIENTAYNQIFNTYNNTTFTLNGLTGIGKTYIDNSSADHLIVTVLFCWKERNGRVIGEDKNLNGVLNGGEDTNGNGKLDSMVQLSTQIYNM